MKVKDLMTTDVAPVSQDAALKDAADVLVEDGADGFAVVDRAGRVVGVLSETDILHKELPVHNGHGSVLDRLLGRRRRLRPKLEARTVGEAMTKLRVTIGPEARVSEAAALMLEQGVAHLPVVEDGKLVGTIAHQDLLRAFARSDEEIAHDLDQLLYDFWIRPQEVQGFVRRGEVVLRGEVDARANAEALATAAREIPGVVSVQSKVRWRSEDRDFAI